MEQEKIIEAGIDKKGTFSRQVALPGEVLKCKECGAELRSKYMIRVDHNHKDPTAKSHFESRTKTSVVGWMKFIMNEQQFEEIQIFNLLTECRGHKEHYKKEAAP